MAEQVEGPFRARRTPCNPIGSLEAIGAGPAPATTLGVAKPCPHTDDTLQKHGSIGYRTVTSRPRPCAGSRARPANTRRRGQRKFHLEKMPYVRVVPASCPLFGAVVLCLLFRYTLLAAAPLFLRFYAGY
jgi:hypothetical protein